MKPKFLTLSLPIALIASFALLGQNQAYAAAETSYSKLTAITVKARVAAFAETAPMLFWNLAL
jgi:hypothetical protein